jgi:hypothetical protein
MTNRSTLGILLVLIALPAALPKLAQSIRRRCAGSTPVIKLGSRG